MQAGRSSLLALALLAALAGCARRDPHVQPFRLSAIDANGRSVVEGFVAPGLVQISGLASRPDATTLVVTPADATPAVTLRFDASARPSIAIPDSISSGVVTLEIRHDSSARGPAGEPLPIRGVRVADSLGRYRFFIGEGDLRSNQGFPLVPRPLGPELGEDVPQLAVVSPATVFEPSKCGDVYYDRLFIAGVTRETVLDQQDSATVSVIGGEDLPWRVDHVQSFHRSPEVTGGECAGALRAWFQAAGSR